LEVFGENPGIFLVIKGLGEGRLMAGTREGGRKAAKTNKAKYGVAFYSTIGKKGGQTSRNGGFAANRELARIAGAKGGKISKRGKAKKNVATEEAA
jgi:general stress protein YciG